ncbi:hypothetical protein CS8_098830 [Cupriavidus sp. 8B]
MPEFVTDPMASSVLANPPSGDVANPRWGAIIRIELARRRFAWPRTDGGITALTTSAKLGVPLLMLA